MIHGKIMGTSKTQKKSIYEVKIPSRLNPSWPKPLVPLITGFSTWEPVPEPGMNWLEPGVHHRIPKSTSGTPRSL